MFVTEVPMFAPMIMGTATSSGRAPAPTAVTTRAVVVDDDWMMAVARTPTNRAMNGLVAKSNRPSAASLPRPLNPSPMTPMATISM